MKENKVYAVAGLPGVGKTTASEYLESKRLAIVRMGELTDKAIHQAKLKISEKAEKKIRKNLRKRFGAAVFASEVTAKVEKNLQAGKSVVIEGMRSVEELKYLLKKFKDLKLIFVNTEDATRRLRLIKRKLRPLSAREIKLRDKYEINKLGIKKLQKRADFIIENNSTFKNFYRRLDEVFA